MRALLIAALSLIICCGGLMQSPESQRLRFVITGNTSPESPFSGFTERLPDLMKAIQYENPVIVVHTGNMVHGGHSWMGINEQDIKRQYGIFFSQLQRLSAVVYTLSGEKDLYNGSAAIYSYYTKKEAAYSFNYGGIHIAMVPLVDIAKNTVKDQLAWLARDLAKFKASQSIFVITHVPVYCGQCARLPEQTAESLHMLLIKYPVKAVFSGSSSRFFETEKDGIRYITAGCGGFVPEEKYKNYNQYYIVDFDGQYLSIEGNKL